jgi:KEOPS complex subunit Pcc1
VQSTEPLLKKSGNNGHTYGKYLQVCTVQTESRDRRERTVPLLRSPHPFQGTRRCNQGTQSPVNRVSGTCLNTILLSSFLPNFRMRNPLPQHKALFRFSTEHAEQICLAVTPELADEVNPRSSTRCRLEGPGTLVVTVEADDTAALRAALNMILRLVNVADEVQGLVKKAE